MNKKNLSAFIKTLILFFLTASLLSGMLFLSALIPKEKIRKNCLSSAEYLTQTEEFFNVIPEHSASRIDRYADAILLNIAYHYDADYPIRSALLSAYYFTPTQDETINYLEAVEKDAGPNQQYLRYWHGSILFVRPLLTFLSIRQIYILHGIVLSVLLAVFLIMAWKYTQKALAIAMALALLLTGSWFVPLSLEYTWTFLVLLISSLIALILASKGKVQTSSSFFLLTGMVTCFLDFLTTETLTLLIPLLIFLWILRPTGRDAWRFTVRCTLNWGIGYVGFWISKWGLTALVYRENVMPYVAEHIGERLGGEVGGVGFFTMIAGAILRNVFCLFPLGYGGAGATAAVALLIAGAYIAYVYRVKEADTKRILLFSAIGLVPFVRFLILHNHSYVHYFFTYRALASTVFAIVLIIAALTGLDAPKSFAGRKRGRT